MAQINEGAGPLSSSSGTPALVFVPPTGSYMSQYTFVVPPGIDTAYVILTVPNSAQFGLLLNGFTFNPTNGWTQFGSTTTYGTRYSLSPGAYTISHNSNALFGAYIFGKDSSDQCSVAYAAGMNLGSTVCVRKFIICI